VIVQNILGDALEAQGRFDDAEGRYRRAIEIDPLMPVSYGGLALLAANTMGDFVTAVPFAEKAMALDPDKPSLLLAALYWNLGDDASFDRLLREAEKRWSDNAAVHSVLTLRDVQGGDTSGAERHARRALGADPREAGALVLLDNIDHRRGRFAESVARYQKAYPELFEASRRIDGTSYWVAISMVPSLQKAGRRDDALALLAGSENVMARLPLLGSSGYAERCTSAGAARSEAGGAYGVAGSGTGGMAVGLALLSRHRPGLRFRPRRSRVQGHLRRHRARHGATAGRAREAAEGCAARSRDWKLSPCPKAAVRDGLKWVEAV